MDWSHWFRQIKVMVWKNLLIKKRKKGYTAYELLFPVYFVAILAVIRLTQPKDLEQFGNFPEYQLADAQFRGLMVTTTHRLLVIPDNAETRNLMADVTNILSAGTNDTYDVEYYAAGTDIELLYKANSSSVIAGIIFDYNNGGNLSYALRFPGEIVPSSKSDGKFAKQEACRRGSGSDQQNDQALMSYNCDVNKYLFSGFLPLQTAIDTALIRLQTGLSNFPAPNITIQMMSKPAFMRDNTYMQVISSMYFVLAYSPFINLLTVELVTEKEKRIKEGMKMMGLQSSAFWLSWVILYVVMIAVVTAVVTVIAYAAKLFIASNMFLFFVLLFLYGLSIICMSFMITPFFNKGRTAGGLASFATILMSVLYLSVSLTRTYQEGTDSVTYKIPVYGRWLMALMSPVALALGIDQAIYLDITKGGATFETASIGEFPLYGPIIMLIIDTILYFLLAVYFDSVIPGEYGPRQKPWFIFTRSFWCGQGSRFKDKRASFTPNQVLIQNNDAFQHDSYTTPSQPGRGGKSDIEPVTADVEAKLAVRISRLTKVFKSKDKDKEDVKAVNELSLNLYEDQITAILGHNGAGKTTLMNILTGMTGPTSGMATVKGMDVSNPSEIGQLRQMTGVCPQHNILFDLLTCAEHLQIFAGIKGVPAEQTDKEVNAALDAVGLKDQADVQSTKLSGGQKRKLSVAIAIIGDPKIIFLDEPTAGMDPYSRRHLWSILKEKKKGRIILLTTHFMDEADILADRKAIVNKGALRCCGSSLFLKNRFGLGYHLNLVVEPNSDTEQIVQHVGRVVNGAELNRVHGKEVDVTLPYTGVAKFPELFAELERPSTVNSLGIKNYGISMTTLEEVFLRLEEDIESIELEEVPDKTNEDHRLIPKNRVADFHALDINRMNNPSDSVECISGRDLVMQRFWALIYMRVLSHIRSPTATVIQLLFPVVLVIIGLVVSNSSQDDFNKQALDKLAPLQLDPGYYTDMKAVPGLTFPYGTVPRLLVRDTDKSTDSAAVVSELNSVYVANSNYSDVYFNDSFRLLDQGIYPHYLGIQINSLPATLEATYKVMYNDSAVHSIPTTISIMSNALLKLAEVSAGIANSNSSITVTTIPWLKFENPTVFNSGLYISSMIIGMAFSLIPSGFAYFVVKDRETKVRSQIRVSGMPFSLYWGTFFCVDFVKFIIPAVLTIIAVFAIGVDSFASSGAALSILITSFVYIPANILLAYVMSFIFDKAETAMGALPTLIFMMGFLPYLPVSMVDMLGNPDTARALHYAFCFLDPAYTIFGAIYYINRVYQYAVFSNSQNDIPFDKYFEMDSGIPVCYIASIVNVVFYMILLRILDVVKTGGSVTDAFRLKPLGQATKPNTDVIKNEDSDIAAERERVRQFQRNALNKQPVVLADELRKEFRKTVKSGACKKDKTENVKVAVRNQTFAVEAGEVFGLLGPNGAGKTTTLNLMIADVAPDNGKVMVAGYDIRSSTSDAFQAMGYCPQHDALLEVITLEEHLQCYAKTRGIPPHKIEEIVDFFIDNLKLGEHRKKRSSKLSGGTKRKLCYCISMLGRPKIVLLDEPSTGMDPQSKRFLWDTISQSFENSERGAILTTHYMEEADALCSRIAIMVNGKMECIGSSQHLKNKYGKGYLLEIKLNVSEGDANIDRTMGELERYITELFPKAVVMEKFSERVQYKVPKSDVTSLSHAFTVLEQGKQECNIAEYSFSQSTLEQVFLEFAKTQVEGDMTEEEQGADKKHSILRAMSVENGDASHAAVADDRAYGFEPVRL